MIIIFSYNRPEMLSRLIDECPIKPVVIDDGSDFDLTPFLKKCDFYRLNHGGKEGFWYNWHYALQICKDSEDDYFTFLADDFYGVDWDVLELFKRDRPFAYNLLNDGRTECFIAMKPIERKFMGVDSIQVGFVDCGYHCNRSALEVLNFENPPVDQRRFGHPQISSGVGSYQSLEFISHGVPMFIPKKSIVKHGNHASMMHPELRIKNPLINNE